jgi:hypothetical protein
MDKMELKELIVKELKESGPYCCYCCQPKGGAISCCEENHFVSFGDLYAEDKKAMIEEQMFEFEEAMK